MIFIWKGRVKVVICKNSFRTVSVDIYQGWINDSIDALESFRTVSVDIYQENNIDITLDYGGFRTVSVDIYPLKD